MTFPSRGCLSCKRRRVKCDETRPRCKRCIKANIECSVAPKESNSFLFLNENDFAIGHQRRPRGPNVKANDKEVMHTATEISTLHSFSNKEAIISSSGPISASLELPLEDQALAYYTNNHLMYSTSFLDPLQSHLQISLLFEARTNANSTSEALRLSILAVSYATFARKSRSLEASTLGRVNYCKALLATNEALRDSQELIKDETVLGVLLLSFYENCALVGTDHENRKGSLWLGKIGKRSFQHHDGALTILRSRREGCVRGGKRTGLDVDKYVRRQGLRSLVLRSQKVPGWMRSGEDFGESGLGLELDRCMVAVAELRFNFSRATSSVDFPGLYQCLKDAQKLDQSLETWEKDLPLAFFYNIAPVSTNGYRGQKASRVLDGNVHVYTSISHAAICNRYRALRLAVNHIILQFCILSSTYNASVNIRILQQTASEKIDRVAGNFCASIPFIFGFDWTCGSDGKVSAATVSLLCWPLAMIMMIDEVETRKKKYLKERLLDVSRVVDDGVLERLATGS